MYVEFAHLWCQTSQLWLKKWSTSTSPACLYISWIRFSGLFQNQISFWNYESFRHFGTTSWTGDQPITRPLFTQGNTEYTCRLFRIL